MAFFTEQKKMKKEAFTGIAASETANNLENFQIHKYRPEKSGHGYAAEDANAFADRLKLKKVEVTGTNNAKNGSDRIVNGVSIQTKYYDNASGTVESAFDKDTGKYRYSDQLLEVPKDQYEECVQIMREKILQGKVEGTTNPDDAEKIIKSGSVTYKQARNIARAGNIDSLLFDSKTQAVTSAYIFAISFAISYAKLRWDGNDNINALDNALKSSIAAAGTTFITGIITAQVLRTRAAAIGTVVVRTGVKSAYHTSVGKSVIEKLASASLGKAVYGAAAFNHVSRLLRSNIITSTVVTVVTTAPDFYRASLSKNISWPQFTKNLIVNISGVAAGSAGWMGGATAGSVIGTAIFPGIGTTIGAVAGGLIGAFAGGIGGAVVAKSISDRFIDDDAKKMIEIVQDITENLACDYLLSENEIEKLSEAIKSEISPNWLMKMYQAGSKTNSNKERAEFAENVIDQMCYNIVTQRPTISLPKFEEVQNEIDKIVEELSTTYNDLENMENCIS